MHTHMSTPIYSANPHLSIYPSIHPPICAFTQLPGAKPGHGGILPQAKITPFIAEARGVPMDRDCISPASHSAFTTPDEFVDFIARLRELSGGKPVGFKLCVGKPEELAAIVRVMSERPHDAPDFITVDGGEGGTGAAPEEFSNYMGMPLVEGLTLTDSFLRGVGGGTHLPTTPFVNHHHNRCHSRPNHCNHFRNYAIAARPQS